MTAHHAERMPLLRKSAWMVGGLAFLGAGAVVGYAVLITHHSPFQGDAVAFRLIARDPFSNGAPLRFGTRTTGVAYRYGRIGYPLTAWLLALGVSKWVGWTLGLVTILSVAVAGLVSAEICARRGRPAWHSVAIFATPVITISLGILYAEPLVIALVLLTYLLWMDDRHVAAAGTAAYLLLAREAAGLALLPLLYQSLRRRERRDVFLVAGAVIPYSLWLMWVRVRVGQWPFLDPATSRRETIGPPLIGFLHAPYIGLLVVTAATLGAAVWLHVRRSWFPLTHGAIVMSVFNLFLKPGVLMYRGDALRVMGPSHVLVILALVANGGSRSTSERSGSTSRIRGGAGADPRMEAVVSSISPSVE